MPDVKTQVPLDNFVQNGDQTLIEILDAISAVNAGIKPGVAQIVRDPATGRLVQVDLTFPDTVSQAAIDAINANPGTVTTFACPAQQFADDLSDSAPDGIVFTTVLEITKHKIFVVTQEGTSFFRLGFLQNPSAGNTYTDGFERPSAAPTIIQLQGLDGATTDFVLANGTLTLNFSATLALPITLNNTLTIPKSTVAGRSTDVELYVDVDGAVYLRGSSINGIIVPVRDYETACSEGPL